MNTKPKNTALLIATKSTKSNFYNPKKISMMFLESIGLQSFFVDFSSRAFASSKELFTFFLQHKAKREKNNLKKY